MRAQGYNVQLKNARERLKLSINEAAARLKIWPITLKLYEEGYVLVRKKHYQNFIDVYGLRDDFFTSSLLYPSEITKNIVVPNIFQKLSRNIFFRLGCLILIGGSIAMICLGYNQIQYSTNNVLTYFPEDSLKVRQNVLSYGEHDKELEKEYHLDNILYLSKTYAIDSNNTFEASLTFTSIESYMKCPVLHANVYTDSVRQYSLEAINGYNGVSVIASSADSSASVTFLVNNFKFSISSVVDENGFTLTDQDPKYYIYSGIALDETLKKMTYFDSFFEYLLNYEFYNKVPDAKYIDDYDAQSFFIDISYGADNFNKSFGGACNELIFGGVFLGLSTFFLVFSAFVLINDYHLLKLSNKRINIPSSEEGLESKKIKTHELKKNFSFPFFIPESFLRVLIIFMLLCASLSSYYFFKMILSFVGLSDPVAFNLKDITNIANFFNIASNFVCIATMMHMLIRIDGFIESKGYIKNALSMFLIGLLFYIFEVLLVYSAQSGLNNLSFVAILVGDYLPGNIFWGMGIYALYALFLFAKPKILQGKKKLSILWQCLSIVPLFYLIISMVYSCLVKANVWNPAPYFVAFLMFPKGLCLTIIICSFCLFVHYFRYFAIQYFGHKKADAFFKGNYYILIKNISACVLILLVGIVDLIIHYTVPSDNVYLKALGLGNNFYILAAIPFVFFYRPHIGPRNNRKDVLYSVTYGVSIALSFVLIGALILPYISYLQPLFDFLAF